ncbi:MAG: hypothetical protein J6P40_10195, partial [Oscillospiraceae bacterium]|nr:hypothetical protein [Oscillospiraceae bacterium]
IDTAKDTLGLLNQDADDIEKIVKNGFRDSYIKAYKDNDEDAMDAIEGILYQAGFDFDYEDWLKTTIKNEDKWLEDYGNP